MAMAMGEQACMAGRLDPRALPRWMPCKPASMRVAEAVPLQGRLGAGCSPLRMFAVAGAAVRLPAQALRYDGACSGIRADQEGEVMQRRVDGGAVLASAIADPDSCADRDGWPGAVPAE